MFSYLSCRARQKQPHSWYFRDVRKEIAQYIRECSIFSLHFQTAGWIGIYHTALTQHFPLFTLIRTAYSWLRLSQLPFKMYLFNDDKRSYNIYLKFQFFFCFGTNMIAHLTLLRLLLCEEWSNLRTREFQLPQKKLLEIWYKKRNNLNLVWPKLALSLHSADFTWSEIMRKQITSLTNLKGTL